MPSAPFNSKLKPCLKLKCPFNIMNSVSSTALENTNPSPKRERLITAGMKTPRKGCVFYFSFLEIKQYYNEIFKSNSYSIIY